jgi:hypothetical protein
MGREEVSRDKILKILNEELSKYKECEDCKFSRVVQFARPDSEGCNWSNRLYLRCSGRPAKSCEPFAKNVINEARKKYNLKG